MTEKHDSDGISRRNVLRSGTVAAGAVTLGVAGFSGTAMASDCPRTPGFWANHDWCEVIANERTGTSVAESIGLTCTAEGATGTYELEGVSKTMEEWMAFLVSATKGDKAVIMAKALLAARLNFQRRQRNDPNCTDEVLDLSAYGLPDMTIIEVNGMAGDWLEASNWPDTQRSWMAGGVDGEPLKNVLDDFNNGLLGSDCDCDGEE